MGDLLNIYCSRFMGGNPLAPPWMFDSALTLDTPDGYEDFYHEYGWKVALTVGQTKDDNVQLFDGDSCFIWEGFSTASLTGNGNATAIRFRDPAGQFMSASRLLLVSLDGHGGPCTPMLPPVVVPPGGQILYDLKETSGAQANTVSFIFRGRKRRLKGGGGAGDWWKQSQRSVPGVNSASITTAPVIPSPGGLASGGGGVDASQIIGSGSGAL